MADSFVQLPDDTNNLGKKVRSNTRTVGLNTVHEHYFIIQDKSSDLQATVLNSAPTTEPGLVVRNIPSGTQAVSQSGTWNITNISGTISLPSGAATEATLATMLTLTGFQSRINTLGQKAMVASTPVVIASDQSAIPVSQSGNWTFAISQTGTDNNVDANITNSTLAVTQSGTWSITNITGTISLPTGAATEATLTTLLTLTGFQARINTLGQKTMSASTPVVLASDQSPLDVESAFATRTDTYTATGDGTTIDLTAKPCKSYSLQVKATGAVTSWDVRLEGSLDNTTFTQILQHTNITGDGVVVFSGNVLSPALYLRSRCAGLVLGVGTNVIVTVLGVQ
jgi:hypothetical protein